jgi:uncharacterized protein with ParB-like and HNH nuclease domain
MIKNVFSIEELFAGRIFSIPDYQRGYAWEESHCMELLDDLELLGPKQNHYTGTIILDPKNDTIIDFEGSSFKKYDIVDGQQRLTSLIILLKVIQSSLAEMNHKSDLAKGIEKKYLRSLGLNDNYPFYKLSLNSDCNDFFMKTILGKTSIAGKTLLSHERLSNAKNIYSKYFTQKQTILKDNYLVWLHELYSKITQQIKVGIYEVDDSSEVGVIFEVTNNRGKNLTELEKVKNYLMYLSSKLSMESKNELIQIINKTWSNVYTQFMLARLSADSENQFLRAHWLMYENYIRRDWDGSKSIKEKFNLKSYINKELDLFNDLKQYVESINDSAIIFADCEKPDRDYAFNSIEKNKDRELVKDLSIKLKRTKTLASFRPLLMSTRLVFPDTANEYMELITILEKFAFRVYNLHGKRADTGQSGLFKEAFNLYNKKTTKFDDVIINIKKIALSYTPDSKFNDELNFNENNNNWYKKPVLRYLLYEYEVYLAKSSKGKIQHAWNVFSEKKLNDTIEHILPQEPSNSYWRKNVKLKDHKIFVHDLGNLCLTLNNSVYSNKAFPDKKGMPGQKEPACYANSSLFQERDLATYQLWNKESIIKRRSEIINWVKERWYFDFSGIELDESEEEFEEQLFMSIE